MTVTLLCTESQQERTHLRARPRSSIHAYTAAAMIVWALVCFKAPPCDRQLHQTIYTQTGECTDARVPVYRNA